MDKINDMGLLNQYKYVWKALFFDYYELLLFMF